MRILPAVLSSIAILTVSIGSSYAANSMSVGIRNAVKDDNGRTYSVSRTSERWCGSGQTCDAPSSISFGGYVAGRTNFSLKYHYPNRFIGQRHCSDAKL